MLKARVPQARPEPPPLIAHRNSPGGGYWDDGADDDDDVPPPYAQQQQQRRRRSALRCWRRSAAAAFRATTRLRSAALPRRRKQTALLLSASFLAAALIQFLRHRPRPLVIPSTCTRPVAERTVYTCGWSEPSVLAPLLFPDVSRHKRLELADVPCLHRNDLLMFGVSGPCPLPEESMEMRSLPLKRIFFSGESKFPPKRQQDQIDGEVFNLGPFPEDDGRTIKLHYASAVMHTVVTHVLGHPEWIYDPSQRRTNGGKRFLLYAQSNCVPYREEAFDALSHVGTVDYAGKCRGDAGRQKKGNVRKNDDFADRTHMDWSRNMDLYSSYRFVLCMENKVQDGYVTEKILNAYLGGSVPVYYGTRESLDMFNPRSFVFYDVHDPTPALDRIRYLEGNKTAYEEVLREPILRDGERTLERYFSLSSDVGGGVLKGRIRRLVGFE